MAIDSRMPADVQNAFNTLLQAELNHEKQMRQARAQQEQQRQLMQLESQKLSNQMFQNALKGQIETKTLQLKAAQQRSEGALETQRFLSEQEDKRQIAREKMQGNLRIKEMATALGLGVQEMKGEQVREQIADRGKQARLTEVTRGEQTRETEAVKQAGKLQLAELNNSAHLKRINKKHNLDLKLSKSENEFKALQKELDRASSALLQKNRLASIEDRSKLDRNLRKLLHSDKLNFQMFENQLNRNNKLAVAELNAGNTDATRESQVKNLRNLAKTYKIMTAASSGADMLNLTGGKHNPESRAYMKIMAALDTAASDVESRGGDWRQILNTYLDTNEIQLALANSDEAAAQFKTLELFLKGTGKMPKIETQGQRGEEIPTYVPESDSTPRSGSGGGTKNDDPVLREAAMKALDEG